MEKTCFKCGSTKPLSEFYCHSRMADGHLNKCKACTKRDVRENRAANIERVRLYDRQRASRPERRASAQAVQAAWRAQHPNRRAAHIAVNNALRAGRMQRLPCLVCGGKAEAHHPDYDRPLDVVWLCPAHHKQAHALVNQMEVENAQASLLD